jgi:hypothetical protein
MSRFLKVFLQDPLDEKIQVAGFGKHPAWDDHIDDMGLKTETLVLTKQYLYSEGIANQLASGAWDQIEKSGNVIEFDHRFVWGRDRQAIVGAIWSSTDRKGRTRFPLVICAQAGFTGARSVDLLFDPIERLGALCRQAKTQEEIREAFNHAQMEINYGILPPIDDHLFSRINQLDDQSILPALITLSAGLGNKRSRGQRETSKSNRTRFRLAVVSSRPKDNLRFWSAYQAAQSAGSLLPCIVIAANGKEWIDLIVGEPVQNDFFCLRANQNALPDTRMDIESKEQIKLESEAKDYLRTLRLGPATSTVNRRSWWSNLFNK